MGTHRRLALTLALGAAALLAAPPAAVAQDAAAESPDAEQAVRDALERTWKIAREGGGQAYADSWDANAMVKQVLAEPDIAKLSKGKRTMIAMGLGLGIRMGLRDDTSVFDFVRIEVRKVDRDGDEAVAVMRGWDEDDYGQTWKIWLARRSDRWRVFDAEEMSQGIRISRLMLAALTSLVADGETPEWLTRMDTLVEAATSSAAMDWETMDARLDDIEDVELPADLEAMRLMLRGIGALRLYEDPAAAIACVDEMVRVYPTTVAGEIIRGRALLELSRPSEVLPAVARYLAVTGPDATALSLRAEALHELGRHREAVEAIRAAAADSPGSADVIGTWLWIAEESEHGEPLRTFRTLRNPETIFEQIVVLLRDVGDAEACELLYEAFAKIRPENVDLAYWRAQSRFDADDAAAGIAFLRPAIDRFRDEGALADDATWPWVRLWLDLHEAAGTLPAAADAFAGDVFALTELGLRMSSAEDYASIDAVADRILAIDPEAPWGFVLRADALLGQGKPEGVEEVLAPLADGTGDEHIDQTVLGRRVAGLVRSGRALDGYDLLGSDAFGDLAWETYQQSDGKQLAPLVERYARDAPDDTLVPFYRFFAMYLNGAYADAVRFHVEHREVLSDFAEYDVHACAVRAAIRVGDLAAAERIALIAREEVESYSIALVRIVQRDAAAAQAAVTEVLDSGAYQAQAFLGDEDAAEALGHESMKPVRALLEARAAEE